MTTLFRRQSQRRHDRGNFIAERRRNWWMPVIAALLALLLWLDVRAAELVRGVIKSTSAYVQVRFSKGPLLEFVTRFDLPDTPNMEGWR